MARPKNPRPPVDAPPRVPDRSLTPEEPLPTMAIRAAGTHQFVYRKMVEGPVGAATPNHGDLVRVVDRDGVQLGYALWNGRSQISLRFLSRKSVPPGPEFWSRRIDEAVDAADQGPRPRPRDQRLPRHPRRGRRPLRPDRRPVRRRPLGRGLQPGHVSADRPDPVAARRSAGDRAFSRGRRRAGRAAGRLFGPAAGQPATAAPRDRAGARDPLSHPFRRGAQDRLLLRSARQPPRPGPVLCRPDRARPVLLHRRLRPERPDPRPGAARSPASTWTRRPSPWHARTATPTRSGSTWSTPTRSATRARWASNGKTFGVVVLDPPKLIPDRDEIAPGKRKYFDLNVLAMKLVEPGGLLVTCSCSGLLGFRGVPGLAGRGRTQGRAAGPAPVPDRRGPRPPGRARRPRRRLPQGRLAPRRGDCLNGLA